MMNLNSTIVILSPKVVQGECSGYVSRAVLAVQWVAVRESKRVGTREGKTKKPEGDENGGSAKFITEV